SIATATVADPGRRAWGVAPCELVRKSTRDRGRFHMAARRASRAPAPVGARSRAKAFATKVAPTGMGRRLHRMERRSPTGGTSRLRKRTPPVGARSRAKAFATKVAPTGVGHRSHRDRASLVQDGESLAH